MKDPEKILPERNAEVHAKHRRETSRHIYLPLILGILLVLAGVVAIIIYGIHSESTLRRWAAVSIIWMVPITMFLAFIFFIVANGVLYAVTKVTGVVPRYGGLIQSYINTAKETAFQVSDLLTEPFLFIRSGWAVTQRKKKSIDKEAPKQ